MIKQDGFNLMNQLLRVCGGVGWVVWLTPTTYIQLAGAGAIDINKLGLSDATLNSSFRTTYKIKFPEPHPH